MNSKVFYKIMAKFYDLLDVVYFRNYDRSPRKVVNDRIKENDKILDLCTGTATNAINIASHFPGTKVLGIDMSKEMLGVAKRKIIEKGIRNIRLYEMDATSLKFKSGCFDKVLISLVLHELEDDLAESMISEAMRVLSDDGEIIVTEWETSRSLLRKLIFAPIHFLEPKPYRTFIKKDMYHYFRKFGLRIDGFYHTDYSKVLVLKKIEKAEEQKVQSEKADKTLLKETPMLDYGNASIQRLIRERGWKSLPEFERIQAIYNYIRDEILFGYNVDDSIPASKVLSDGYGQCNTKGTLFMALLRACDIPCRVHGFTIDKELQKGAMTGFVYKQAPKNVFHSWVEVYFEERWYELEAFIVDRKYLRSLQTINSECAGAFCGYGVGVKNFKSPVIDFNRNNTYIQSEGINQDFGIYDSPDDLLKEHGQEIGFIKKLAFRYYGRHMMNRNVRKIRNA